MSEITVTAKQLDFMRHATGGKRKGHRNHFAASDEDVPIWRDLVAKGLATEHAKSSWCDYPTFSVTAAGLDFAYGR